MNNLPKPTIAWMQKKYKEWNALAFANKLPKEMNFELDNDKNAAGKFTVNVSQNPIKKETVGDDIEGFFTEDNYLLKDPIITLSVYFNHGHEEQYLDVLLHEMIHCYEFYCLKYLAHYNVMHGATFTNKMKEINTRFGRNIQPTDYFVHTNKSAVYYMTFKLIPEEVLNDPDYAAIMMKKKSKKLYIVKFSNTESEALKPWPILQDSNHSIYQINEVFKVQYNIDFKNQFVFSKKEVEKMINSNDVKFFAKTSPTGERMSDTKLDESYDIYLRMAAYLV